MNELTLDTICDGHLAEEFKRYLPALMESIQETGKPASLNIKLTFKPVKDMDTMFTAHAKVRPSLPVKEKGSFFQWAGGKAISEGSTLGLPFGEPVMMTTHDYKEAQ